MVASLRMQLDWKLVLFAILLIIIFIGLGFWQLLRAEEKKQLLMEHRLQRQASIVELNQLADDQVFNHQRVILAGYFDNEKTWLLDNRIKNGKTGYEVISAFLLLSGETVFLNRGWLEGDRARRFLPVVRPIYGEQKLLANIYIPQKKLLALRKDQWQKGWPKVIQQFDAELMATDVKDSYFPYQLRIETINEAAYTVDWPVVAVRPEKHGAYALQWFLMAVVVLLLMIKRYKRYGIHEG